MQARRGDTPLRHLDLGVAQTTLSGVERGSHTPSPDTAMKLAAWLGWTLEQVYEAAATPA